MYCLKHFVKKIKLTISGRVRSLLESESGFRMCSDWPGADGFRRSERPGRQNRECQPGSEKFVK
jgi:hypothetical protein